MANANISHEAGAYEAILLNYDFHRNPPILRKIHPFSQKPGGLCHASGQPIGTPKSAAFRSADKTTTKSSPSTLNIYWPQKAAATTRVTNHTAFLSKVQLGICPYFSHSVT